MNTAVRIPIVIAIVITICFQSCRNRSQNHPVLVNNNNTELYYEKVEKDNEIVDWDENLRVERKNGFIAVFGNVSRKGDFFILENPPSLS